MAAAVTVTNFAAAALLLPFLILDLTVGEVGVCYGTNGSNLPSPSQVVALCNDNNIKRMRIYAPDQSILGALSGSNIELMLGVSNTDIQNLASSQANATAWFRNNVRRYPNVRFRYIVVGNEATDASSRFLLPALQNLYAVVSAAGLGSQIRVSTAISPSVLQNSYPPSSGTFRVDASSYLNPIIRFLENTSAPLLVNIYPYFTYINNPTQVRLELALLQPNQVITMPDGIRYGNLFHMILDAMYAAVCWSMKHAQNKARGRNVKQEEET